MSSLPDAPGSDPSSFPTQTSPENEARDGALLFGRYRVERELGRGGMGQVVKAFDTKLHIPVAVKLVPDQLVPDTEAVNDLRQEVLRGMALMHHAIVRTNNFELDESGAAIVMEYIDGFTLTELKEQQAGRCFDPEQLLPWVTTLAEVLDYAHQQARIVHRDLKPRNIMLSRDGRLKVADFGISATLSDSLTRNTGHGPTSGTPPYMSPQQATGKRPSAADDLYALGATIYDLLTGKPPFFRGPPQGIFHQVMNDIPPSMSARREELNVCNKAPIPAAWEETVAALLAKDPTERPKNATAVLARLTTAPSVQAAAKPEPLDPTLAASLPPTRSERPPIPPITSSPVEELTRPAAPQPKATPIDSLKNPRRLRLCVAYAAAHTAAVSLVYNIPLGGLGTHTVVGDVISDWAAAPFPTPHDCALLMFGQVGATVFALIGAPLLFWYDPLLLRLGKKAGLMWFGSFAIASLVKTAPALSMPMATMPTLVQWHWSVTLNVIQALVGGTLLSLVARSYSRRPWFLLVGSLAATAPHFLALWILPRPHWLLVLLGELLFAVCLFYGAHWTFAPKPSKPSAPN